MFEEDAKVRASKLTGTTAWEIGERFEEVGRRRWEGGQARRFTVLSEARPLSEARRAASDPARSRARGQAMFIPMFSR